MKQSVCYTHFHSNKVFRGDHKSLLSVCFIAAGYVLISALIMFQVEPGIFKSFYDAIC